MTERMHVARYPELSIDENVPAQSATNAVLYRDCADEPVAFKVFERDHRFMERFQLSANQAALCGFQHGSCVALAASMLRFHDPYTLTILFEPYLLESYYLKDEPTIPPKTVVCLDNQHIRQRTRHWLHVETDLELSSYGLRTQQITVTGGGDTVELPMIDEAVRVVKTLCIR